MVLGYVILSAFSKISISTSLTPRSQEAPELGSETRPIHIVLFKKYSPESLLQKIKTQTRIEREEIMEATVFLGSKREPTEGRSSRVCAVQRRSLLVLRFSIVG